MPEIDLGLVVGPTGAQGATGPVGADGKQGERGIPGKDGAPGAQGDPGADGKSAYETASASGYVGSEAQFGRDLADVQNAVKYNASQTLTEEQKQQARENIGAPAPYTAGENISISGSVIATKAFPCNPKILDNWYFGNPVNQRGASYVENNYGLDRWKGTYGVNANGTMGFNSSGFAIQGLEDSVKNILNGMTLTASILYANGTLHTGTAVYTKTGDAHNFIDDGNIQFNNQADGNILLYAQSADQIKAVGLELGTEQTLAHQENGVWVLNEIPKFGDQLAECQRYFEWVDVQLTKEFNGSIPYKVVKRTTPAFTYYSANGTVGKISQYNGTNGLWDDVEPSASPTDFDLRSIVLYVLNQNVTRFRVAVSADL